MGFELEDTISVYTIKFGPNSPYFGLCVEVGGMTIGEHNKMLQLAVTSVTESSDEGKAKANLESNDHVRECFFKRIRSWNLTKNNEPVPVTEEVLDQLDSRLVTVLIRCWLDELTNLPEDLLGKSNNGATSLELSLTTEPLSQSQWS